MATQERTYTPEEERFDCMMELLRENVGVQPVQIVCNGIKAAVQTREKLVDDGYGLPFRYRDDELTHGRQEENGRTTRFEERVIDLAESAGQLTLVTVVENEALVSRECWHKPEAVSQ